MVPVGVAHVGSVAVAVTVGAPGAVPTVTSTEDSQPAAFFTHTLWAPLLMPVKPLAGNRAWVPLSNLYSRPEVAEFTVKVTVGNTHFGSVTVAVTTRVTGSVHTVTV